MTTHPKPGIARGFAKLVTAALLCAGVQLTVTTAAEAAQNGGNTQDKIWKDIGASERIDLSGRLHMLSQRIAASACAMEAGVEETISRGILMGSADEVDRIMNALENGNPLMKIIGSESNSRIKANIDRINQQWLPVRSTIDALDKKGYENANMAIFEAWNIPYYEDANILVSEIAAEYSNPADLLQRDAILVDLAGRQRMRTQMMLKQACEIWKGKDASADLLETIGLFDRTHSALLNGAPGVGINAAPTPELKAALDGMSGDWEIIKVMLTGIASGANVDKGTKTALYLSLNEALIQSHGIVGQYAKYAKQANNAF
ncbi:MAG: type IV pili methyl-accepting chemotaxis transducer N-terminal domain-containing protein [Aliishimia sp.]